MHKYISKFTNKYTYIYIYIHAYSYIHTHILRSLKPSLRVDGVEGSHRLERRRGFKVRMTADSTKTYRNPKAEDTLSINPSSLDKSHDFGPVLRGHLRQLPLNFPTLLRPCRSSPGGAPGAWGLPPSPGAASAKGRIDETETCLDRPDVKYLQIYSSIVYHARS